MAQKFSDIIGSIVLIALVTTLVLLVITALAVIQVMPMTGFIPNVEKLVSERVQAPVAIGGMRFNLFPSPQLKLDNVAIGATLRGQCGFTATALRLDRHEEQALAREAAKQIRRVGLEDVMFEPAGSLPLGRQRLVEGGQRARITGYKENDSFFEAYAEFIDEPKEEPKELEALARAKFILVDALNRTIGDLRSEREKEAFETALLPQGQNRPKPDLARLG